MSERIYGWLLRLYPAHFRRRYGDAAMQVFRDRCNGERGFLRIRLWVDLLADLVVSLPREYQRVPSELVSAAALSRLDGAPAFCLLEGESPRLGALLLGGALSLLAVAASIPVAHIADFRPFSLGPSAWSPAVARWTASNHWNADAAGPANRAVARSGVAGTAETPLESSSPRQIASELPELLMLPRARSERLELDAAERQQVIGGIIANLKQYYVDPPVAGRIGEALLAHEQSGDYDVVTDPAIFAFLLTKHVREVSHDLHLEVVYSRNALPERSNGLTPERFVLYRKAVRDHNCTIENVEVLSHNVGYLKLNSFPEPSICGTAAKAAMAALNRTDAIIFDLRDNRGGYAAMVMLIAAYLFDHPEYMYNPRGTSNESWTHSPVPGSRLADKPVYVLTSTRTFSGAEHFSYDLKMLKRATLVGERTAGATDVAVFHRIDDHFGIGIREVAAVNPYSEPDWAVNGVEPHVKVPAGDALVTAEKLVDSKLGEK